VCDEAFVHHVPGHLDQAAVAPLLCAGITTYSPLRHWGAGRGKKVGIVGLGGLGHMGLKFAHSFGAETVQFTTSEKKREDARALGAREVVLSTDPAEMKKHARSFDLILDTVSAPHSLDDYTALLGKDGTLVLVGMPEQPPTLNVLGLPFRRASVAGSIIGGMAETQEMLDYCGANNIVAEVEVVAIDQAEACFERMLRGDVKYRFVIDMKTLA
jgi:uncharacterized zinc-type alcohol dehydrogenase-like protein